MLHNPCRLPSFPFGTSVHSFHTNGLLYTSSVAPQKKHAFQDSFLFQAESNIFKSIFQLGFYHWTFRNFFRFIEGNLFTGAGGTKLYL